MPWSFGVGKQGLSARVDLAGQETGKRHETTSHDSWHQELEENGYRYSRYIISYPSRPIPERLPTYGLQHDTTKVTKAVTKDHVGAMAFAPCRMQLLFWHTYHVLCQVNGHACGSSPMECSPVRCTTDTGIACHDFMLSFWVPSTHQAAPGQISFQTEGPRGHGPAKSKTVLRRPHRTCSIFTIFPTCQVRVVRFYQSCSPPPPRLAVLLLLLVLLL